jgi:phosphocarrier protein HPr
MIKTTVTISNKLGLHARASAKLTKLAGSFACEVWMSQGRAPRQRQEHHGRDDAGRRHRQQVEIETNGPDEQEAMDALVALINDKFGEGE